MNILLGIVCLLQLPAIFLLARTIAEKSNISIRRRIFRQNWVKIKRSVAASIAGKRTVLTTMASLIFAMLLLLTGLALPSEIYAQSGNWTSKKPIPSASYGLNGAFVGGKFYAISGFATARLGIYDPTTDTWTTGTPLPADTGYNLRQYFGAAVLDGKIYVIGGDTGGSGDRATLYRYDPVLNSWTTLASMPLGSRYGLSAAAINGKIYAVGGYSLSSATYLDRLEVYDPVTNKWATRTSMPTARSGALVGAINEKLLVAGGINASGPLTSLHIYDPAIDSWSTGAPMPFTGNGDSVVLEGRLFSIGAGPSPYNRVFAYDAATNAWSTNYDPIPTGRWDTGVAADEANGNIYVVGGWNGGYVSALEVFATTPAQSTTTTTNTTTALTTTTTVASTTTTTLDETGTAATLNFVAGWNLMGNSSSGALDVTSIFGDADKVTTVWKWVALNSNWAFYTPLQTDGGAAYAAGKGYAYLSTVAAGEGFWVNTKAAFTAPLPSGTSVSSDSFQGMASGWSLIAIGDNKDPREFNQAIGLIQPSPGVIPLNLTTLWAWDAQRSNWYFYAPSLDQSGELVSYVQSKGYLDFFSPSTKTLDATTGFWVNVPAAAGGATTSTTAGTTTSTTSTTTNTAATTTSTAATTTSTTLAGTTTTTATISTTTPATTTSTASTTTTTLGGNGQTAVPLTIYSGQSVGACFDTYTNTGVVTPQTLFAYGGMPLSGYTWTLSPGSVFPAGTTVIPLTGSFTSNGSALVSTVNGIFNMTVSDGFTTASGNISYHVDVIDSRPANGIPGVPCGAAIFAQSSYPVINLPAAQAGEAYGASLYAEGKSTLPWSWAVANGNLVGSGLVVDQTRGVVRGVPLCSAGGTNISFTVRVTDAAGDTATCANSGCPAYVIPVDPC